MNVPAGKILKRVDDLDPAVFNEQGQFLWSMHKGMWRAEEGPLGVPCAGVAGVFQPKSEHNSSPKIQKRTQDFGSKSKVV